MKSFTGRYKGISIFLTVSVLAAVVCNILTLILSPMLVHKVAAVFGLVGCFLALQYMLMGFRKSTAKIFKLFMLVLFFSNQLATIGPALVTTRTGSSGEVAVALTVGAHCMLAAFAMALALGENIGEKLSKSMAIIMLCLTILFTVITYTKFPGAVRGGNLIGTAVVLRAGSNVVLAEIAMAMIEAKYKDKHERMN